MNNAIKAESILTPTAILLAAGQGERLRPISGLSPKTLLDIGGKTLIKRSSDFIQRIGISKTIVVVGYRAEDIIRELSHCSSDICFALNHHFVNGSCLSIKSALPFLHTPFLILNADHIYQASMAARFRSVIADSANMTVFADRDRVLGHDDMKIDADEHMHLYKISKSLTTYQFGYIGVTYVPHKYMETYKDAAESICVSSCGKASAEAILDYLVARGEIISIVDVGTERWFEVDTADDYRDAQEAASRGVI